MVSTSHSASRGRLRGARRPSRSPPRRRGCRPGCAPPTRRSSARRPRWRPCRPRCGPRWRSVSASSRPIGMAAIARAAAAIALRPASGRMPACAALPLKRASSGVVGRRSDHDLADRRGVVEHKAEVGAQARAVERLGALQRLLLAGGEQDLDPGRRPAVTHDPPRGAHDRRNRGLVVGAEDGLVAVR